MLCNRNSSDPRREQEEGSELDSHEEVRLSFAGPGEIKSREVELGSEGWTCLLLQFFLNSCATDIVFVTAPHSSSNSN